MAQRIDVDRVIELVGAGATLIDVLPETIFRQEHLPGAINVPLQTFTPAALDDVPRDRPVVVYCFDQH